MLVEGYSFYLSSLTRFEGFESDSGVGQTKSWVPGVQKTLDFS